LIEAEATTFSMLTNALVWGITRAVRMSHITSAKDEPIIQRAGYIRMQRRVASGE
jgi:hypothetical protein